MRMNVLARGQLSAALREHAETRLSRLERHASGIHEVRLTLDEDPRRVPACMAEVIAHLHHNRLVARVDATTAQEAVDRVIDKIDRQILRIKDRVTEHKGHAAAGSDPLQPAPRHAYPETV